jgi:hypothetical protein
LHDDGRRVIHVHAIVTRSPDIVLSVSTYIFRSGLPFARPNKAGDDELFLIYSDWMKAGREDDAEDLVISQIEDIIEPCQLSIPGEVADGPDFSSPPLEPIGTTGSQSPRKFLVQWGISADSLKTELQAKDKLRLKTLEIRNLNNPGDKIGIDPSDTLSLQEPFIALNLSCGLGGLSTGFAEAGFNVAVGVETDIAAANSWKVLFLTDKYLT